MSARRARVEVTPAQLRCINAALALLEAEVESGDDVHDDVRPDVLMRTRRAVWGVMMREEIEP